MEYSQSTKPSLLILVDTILIYNGLIFSAYLAYLSATDANGAFCELFKSNCTAVVQTPYGDFFGISVASIGLGYFLFLGGLRIGYHKLGFDLTHAAVIIDSILRCLSLMISGYFSFLMVFILDEKCFACFMVHATNLGLFLRASFQSIKIFRSLPSTSLPILLGPPPAGMVYLLSFFIGLNGFLLTNFFDAKNQLKAAQLKINQNHQFYQYLYEKSPKHDLTISDNDIVVGEKAIAIHQITLFYKDNCNHCFTARNKLIDIVRSHESAVYLVLKNARTIPKQQLNSLEITKLPAVFIDGKFAQGWMVPGFLEKFTEDCGC